MKKIKKYEDLKNWIYIKEMKNSKFFGKYCEANYIIIGKNKKGFCIYDLGWHEEEWYCAGHITRENFKKSTWLGCIKKI